MEKIRCFSHGTVVCDLECREKYPAIRELLRKAPVFRNVEELGTLEEAVVTRERIQSTGIGNGIAVAHGKCGAVGGIVMALGISRSGIEFDSYDGSPVHFLFIVANPPGMQLEYLLALSVLMRALRDERFRSSLLGCKSSEEIENRLAESFRECMHRRGYPFG